MQGTITARLCDACGQPARYRYDERDDQCEECARNRGAESNGRACAAIEFIGCAISMLRGEQLTDEMIREAVESILTAPHSTAQYAFGGDEVLGPDGRENRPWARLCTPIGEEAA